MSAGRRVAITGASTHWGGELARRLERDPGVDYIAGIDTLPPPVELSAPTSSRPTCAAPLLSRLLPATEVDTVVHCGILWYPEPGKPGPRPARDQRDRDPAAARRLRAHRDAARA